jgi:hypothetical protein
VYKHRRDLRQIAGEWDCVQVTNGVYMSGIPWAATKIATPQTPATAGAWPESRRCAYLLLSSLDMLARSGRRRDESQFILRVEYIGV